ncbi:hypothetical protein [Saccharopolyspora taberi]|uniref:Uncharacterized protein n=1 Tax=Saccharopolyspora taberi TaxID=60895 RepID=A0ABN3VM05_9PSEU
MTPEERSALIRKYIPKREDLSPEVRANTEEALRYTEEKIARGEVLESWSKDNFPIGLDKNLEPYPLTDPDETQR